MLTAWYKTPSDICKFSLTPQNNQEHQSMPTSLTALKRLWGHPSGGGGNGLDIKWNGPSSLVNKSELWQISGLWASPISHDKQQISSEASLWPLEVIVKHPQNEYNIYSILNVWVTSLFQPPYCFYPRVAAMLPWKHARFQDGVNETLIDIIKVSSLFSTYCAH